MTDPTAPVALPLSSLRPGLNPRRYFNQRAHDELVTSLRLRGMLQTMLVRPAPESEEGYLIVNGGRRYLAALEAFGKDHAVPVLVREMSDQEALEAAIDENDCRDDASETEQADAAVRVLAACQGDRAEAARRLGWSQAKLERRLALANLCEPVKVALDERRIKVGHAELLAAVPGDKQEKALETILTAALDVNKTRELLMRVTQSLAGAPFDKSECTTCPFNSASQRALFETHVDDGHCTNPGCYQLKSEAAAASKPAPEAEQPAKGKGRAKATGKAAPTAPDTPAPETPAPEAPEHDAPAPAAKTAPKKQAVTARSLAARVTDIRDSAWRAALVQAAEGDPEVMAAFEACLRDSWKVDRGFLGRFNKDELKFIAQECGLVAHMGEKQFAKLLQATTEGIISGMLHATGFDWAGRLPSAMTIDGKFGSPPALLPIPETTDKD
ncbi:PRTRC system ParB family protein [Novosphingobium sp. ST904]|uniref:PRTRC system ParB family protein n=1 Tax=Novosphingobium sp. ST904 TaxID=1684385 RepID=UPI0006C8CACF|nr:PRTRC system ParB family protein [Novosphingobium sp. ST904]KPH60376.1 chromosome partitioning protein ParB [Novosphingobium sp. ST904]TCM40075.1 PRTRC genetic system ParB family protein [Novosphingobium sp. ST904]